MRAGSAGAARCAIADREARRAAIVHHIIVVDEVFVVPEHKMLLHTGALARHESKTTVVSARPHT